MRSVRCLFVVGLLLFVLASPVTARSGSASDLRAQRRALAAYAAMQRYFYAPATRSYNGIYPAAGHAQVWPYSQALWATLELAHLPRAGLTALADVPIRQVKANEGHRSDHDAARTTALGSAVAAFAMSSRT